MIQHLAHIGLITCLSFIWGAPLLLIVSRDAEPSFWIRSPAIFFSLLFFSGLVTLSGVTSWLYLLLPLRFILLLPTTIVLAGVLYFFCRRRIILLMEQVTRIPRLPPLPRIVILFILVCLFLFAALSSLRTVNGDTQIYHLQIVQWAHQYRAVPGIANLFPKIGTGSNWFGLIALFQLPWFSQENFSYLNACMVIWFFIWLVSNWYYHFSRLGQPGSSPVFCAFYFLTLVYMLYDWELFRDAANSTSYDLIVTATIFMATAFLFESIWEPAYDKPFSLIFVVLTLSAIGFKFSGIFAVLLVGYHLRYHFSYARFGTIVLLSILLITPVLIKNYIITGYPFYPSSIAIASPDWRMPRAMVDLERNFILLSNRFYNGIFYNTFSFRDQHPFWLPIWFRGILWQHKVLMLLIVSSIPLLWSRSLPSAQTKRLRLCLLLLWTMIAGWLFTAPSPRFGYGSLLPVAFLPVSVWLGPRIKSIWYLLAVGIATAALVVYIPFKLVLFARQPSIWLRPQAVEVPPYQNINAGGIDLHLAERLYQNQDRRSYNTPIPFIREENPYIRPRSRQIKDGFKMFPTPDSLFIQNYQY